MKQHTIFFCRDKAWAQSQKLGATVLVQSLQTRANDQLNCQNAVLCILFWRLTLPNLELSG